MTHRGLPSFSHSASSAIAYRFSGMQGSVNVVTHYPRCRVVGTVFSVHRSSCEGLFHLHSSSNSLRSIGLNAYGTHNDTQTRACRSNTQERNELCEKKHAHPKETRLRNQWSKEGSTHRTTVVLDFKIPFADTESSMPSMLESPTSTTVTVVNTISPSCSLSVSICSLLCGQA